MRRTHVYHLKVHFVSTACMGKEEPEVTKEKGLLMIEKAVQRTDLPGEVRRILSGWLTDNSDDSEVLRVVLGENIGKRKT